MSQLAHQTYQEHFLANSNDPWLQLFYCGYAKCRPGHTHGPAMRDHFVIHYIVSGQGSISLEHDRSTYMLRSGDSFCLFPNMPFFYKADEHDPWEYCWVGFSGQRSDIFMELTGMTTQTPIHSSANPKRLLDTYISLLSNSKSNDPSSEAYCLDLLIQLFSYYIRDHALYHRLTYRLGKPAAEAYVQKAITFIKTNYAKKISISLIARYVGLERAYFTKLFQEKMNNSPYNFLINYRMEKATRLLLHTDQSVQLIAGSVGFDDSSYFSKVFTKRVGCSPTEFRKMYR